MSPKVEGVRFRQMCVWAVYYKQIRKSEQRASRPTSYARVGSSALGGGGKTGSVICGEFFAQKESPCTCRGVRRAMDERQHIHRQIRAPLPSHQTANGVNLSA